ncbi:uncharacterized protein LOC113502999 [Trichoplusia ni]|uniref:Uncharacterized protein LOC113502999 n=1 Tax=Trichoplusia ni TaxID=7111 RepID=A0A7E5WKC3_TRINI|nr:uncharacterized protein LOC113502999 [Trichoplusia ni]
MAKVIFAITLTLVTFTLIKCANTKSNQMTKEAPVNAKDQDSSIDVSDLDTQAIMNACNESFRIEMSYLESLNTSGSFIDETDKTPKCFLRCVLENTGILSEDGRQFNPARAASVFAGERNGKPMDDLNDMTGLCAADRQETCPCDRAYKFLRCLMSMEIEKYETAQ